MLTATDIKHAVFSGLSWRAEARAASLSPDRGQRFRDRVGHLMRWTRAHDSLPDLEQRAVILCFHSVVGRPPDPDVECEALYVGEFRKLLAVLRRSFHVISLAELVAAIRERRSPPPRSVVITFDDGYANNHTVAAEELAALHMPWSAFLPARLVETAGRQWIDDVRLLIHRGRRQRVELRWEDQTLDLDLATRGRRHETVRRLHELCRYLPEPVRQARLARLYEQYSTDELESLRAVYPSFAPMTWGQARELKAAGVDVGSHSLTHTALGPQPVEAIRHEVFAARDLLRERIGDHSPHFSYPYGRNASLSDRTEAILVEAGYNCALTLEQDSVRCDHVNLMQLPRLIVSPSIGRMVFNLWQRFLR